MKTILALCLLGFCAPALGQDKVASDDAKIWQVETTWPGIFLQISQVKRIDGNRLVVTISVFASFKAPESTVIGTPPPPLPPDASPEERKELRIPRPYSIANSTMTEEKTGQKFAPVSPDPRGQAYAPSAIMSTVTPGHAVWVSVQFPVPPPPAPDNTGKIPKQTVSILLPNATGPITGVVIPPADATTPAP